jgi:hypothetical protein
MRSKATQIPFGDDNKKGKSNSNSKGRTEADFSTAHLTMRQ